jgi:hypothetical protein
MQREVHGRPLKPLHYSKQPRHTTHPAQAQQEKQHLCCRDVPADPHNNALNSNCRRKSASFNPHRPGCSSARFIEGMHQYMPAQRSEMRPTICSCNPRLYYVSQGGMPTPERKETKGSRCLRMQLEKVPQACRHLKYQRRQKCNYCRAGHSTPTVPASKAQTGAAIEGSPQVKKEQRTRAKK